jgi:type IV pilus assembly protein PilW
MSTEHLIVRIQGGQKGFTLIEIMIALLIGIFLLGALLTIVQTNRAVFGNQNQLAQLQDSERMAMTLMADVIQSAGYYPDAAISNTQALAFPAAVATATAAAFASGQPISGTYAAADPGDVISVRYMTKPGDGILNCSGQSNPSGSGANKRYVNTFQVLNGQLVCTDQAGAPYNLVSGVTNSTGAMGVIHLTVLYGVKTNLATAGNNVDTYLRADQMNATNWNNVISVFVALDFTNPLYVAAGQGQAATIKVQRVINVMNQVGPTI